MKESASDGSSNGERERMCVSPQLRTEQDMDTEKYRLSRSELILSWGVILLPVVVALLFYSSGQERWGFLTLYIFLPVCLVLTLARSDQRRSQLKQLILKDLVLNSDVEYHFGERFQLKDVTSSGIFPEINMAYCDSQETSYLATKMNIVFSQISCAVGGSATRGVPTYIRLGDYIFFKTSVDIKGVSGTIVILPARWKRQFGWKKALLSMGYWPESELRPLAVPVLKSRYVYQKKGAALSSAITDENSDVFTSVSEFINGKNAALLRDICVAFDSETFYAVLPIRLKISICSSTHNVKELKNYLSKINIVLDELEQLENKLKVNTLNFTPQDV